MGAYVVIGAACVPVIAVWVFVNRQTLAVSRGRMVSDFAMNWKFARWLFVGAVVYSANDTLYFWVLSWLHGTASVGMLAAANGAIFLANPLILGALQLLRSARCACLCQRGHARFAAAGDGSLAGVGAMMLLFTLVLVFCGRSLVALLFGRNTPGKKAS